MIDQVDRVQVGLERVLLRRVGEPLPGAER